MANETQQAGRGSFGAATEATENSAETINLATGSALPAMNVKISKAVKMIENGVIAPHRGGVPMIPGDRSEGCDFETFLYPCGLSGSSSRPIDEAALRLVGFGAPTYAAGPPKTLTRQLLSLGHGSATLERQTIDKTAGSNGIKETWTGCRANGKLSHGAHDPLKLSVMGCRAAGYTQADTSSAPSVVLRDTEGDRRMPFIAHKCVATVTDQDASAYGGKLLGLNLDLGNEVIEDRAVGSTDLPYQITIKGNAPAGTLTVQRLQAADYNFFSKWHTAQKALAISLVYTAPSVGTSNTTDTLTITFACNITSIEETEVGGIIALNLGISLIWPTDGTAVGRTSADVITLVHTSTA